MHVPTDPPLELASAAIQWWAIELQGSVGVNLVCELGNRLNSFPH